VRQSAEGHAAKSGGNARVRFDARSGTLRALASLVKVSLAPLLALTTGCVGFVVPPVKLSAGTGPVAGLVERGTGDLDPTSATTLRAGFHPLSLMREAPSSAFDAGVGYGGDLVLGHAPPTFNRRTTVHGPYVEGAYYPLRLPAGGARFRMGVRANADVLFLEPRGVTGYGGTLVTELEIGGYVDGTTSDQEHEEDDDDAFTAVFGSWSLGAFAGGSFRAFPDSGYAGLAFGLSVRLPFIAAVACCFWPGDDDDDDDDAGVSSSSKSTTWRLPKRRHETRPATPVRSSSPREERIPTPKRDELKRR
jgi:hypothetical protein